eukprot:362598-Chlamydomonas_euryale.AAC.2
MAGVLGLGRRTQALCSHLELADVLRELLAPLDRIDRSCRSRGGCCGCSSGRRLAPARLLKFLLQLRDLRA